MEKMKDQFKSLKGGSILLAVLYLILGIAALVMPDTMMRTLGYVIGIALIGGGVIFMFMYLTREVHQNLLRNDFLYGLSSVLVGIVVLAKVELIIDFLPVLLGILIMISGCAKLQDVIDMLRMKSDGTVPMLIVAVLNLAFGVILLINPFKAAVVLFRLLGAGLLFSGASDLFKTFYFSKVMNQYMKDVEYHELHHHAGRAEGGCADENDNSDNKEKNRGGKNEKA